MRSVGIFDGAGHALRPFRRIALSLTAFTLAGISAAVDFVDTELDLADYSVENFRMVGGISYSRASSLIGGNPDACLIALFGKTATGSSSVREDLIHNDFRYTPSVSGAIQTIRFRIDTKCEKTAGTWTFVGNAGVICIVQDGRLYRAATATTQGLNIWITNSKELRPSDFIEIDRVTGAALSHRPDFGPGGTEMALGITVSWGWTGTATGLGARVTYDNLRIHMRPVFATLAPTGYVVTEGSEFLGGLDTLLLSDDSWLSIFNDSDTLRCQVEVYTTSPHTDLTDLYVTVEESVARAGLACSAKLWNFDLDVWDKTVGHVASGWDNVLAISDSLTADSYVDNGSGLMRALVTWDPINDEDPAQDGWLHFVDQVVWLVNPY